MDGSKVIKQLLLERNITKEELADQLGIKKQSMHNKLNRGTYSLAEFERIINFLDAEILIQTTDTKKIFN